MSSNAAHGSAALRGTTTTRTGALEAIVNGKLLACLNFSETVEEDFSAKFAHGQIRIAAVIDELGTASSYWSIELPASIQLNRVNTPYSPRQEQPHGAAHGFALADSFTGILNDPLARRNRFFCEHTKPFDTRTPNEELETGEFQVQTRNVMLGGHINRAEKAGVANQQLAAPW
jgi:hypothetical protein